MQATIEEALAKERLLQIWKKLREKLYRDHVPDMILHEDFNLLVEDATPSLRWKLENDRYRRDRLDTYEFPKRLPFFRVLGFPSIRDRLIFASIVETIYDIAEPGLLPGVCQYRKILTYEERAQEAPKLESNASSKEPNSEGYAEEEPLPGSYSDYGPEWMKNWVSFDSKTREAMDRFKFVLRGDITAYYDNIDHKLLEDLLTKNGWSDTTLANLVREFLRDWAPQTLYLDRSTRGIPTGPEMFSKLANLFLTPLDELCSGKLGEDGVYLRYGDDFRLFHNDREVLEKALGEIIHVLRRHGLHVNEDKTQIQEVEGINVTGNLCLSPEGHALGRMLDVIRSEKREPTKKEACEARNIFGSIIKAYGTDDWGRYSHGSALKICLEILRMAKDDHALDFVLERLPERPDWAYYFAKYLREFPTERTLKAVRKLVLDNRYPDVPKITLFELLVRCPDLDVKELDDVCEKIARNNKVLLELQSLGIFYMGLCRPLGDLKSLIDMWRLPNPKRRRAIMLAALVGPYELREKIWNSARDDDHRLVLDLLSVRDRCGKDVEFSERVIASRAEYTLPRNFWRFWMHIDARDVEILSRVVDIAKSRIKAGVVPVFKKNLEEFVKAAGVQLKALGTQ